MIGVNNRDLQTLQTSLETSLALLPAGPARARGGERERHLHAAPTSRAWWPRARTRCWWARRWSRAGDVAAKVRELTLA